MRVLILHQMLLLLLIIGVLLPKSFAAEVSEREQLDSSFCQSPSGQDCSFYSKCLEVAQSCGVKGYALGYGEPYCRKFKSNESLLSKRGKSFSIQTRKCLMQKLVPRLNFMIAKPESKSCDSTKRYAYSTHVACYTNHVDSICDLSPLTDLPVIVSQVKAKDLFLREGRKQVQEIAKVCLARLIGLKTKYDKSNSNFDVMDVDMKIKFWEKSLQEAATE